jgi:hypothetical protein
MKVCSDEEYEIVSESTNAQLESKGKWADILEKVVQPYVEVTNDKCVLEEYLLDIRAEPDFVS